MCALSEICAPGGHYHYYYQQYYHQQEYIIRSRSTNSRRSRSSRNGVLLKALATRCHSLSLDSPISAVCASSATKNNTKTVICVFFYVAKMNYLSVRTNQGQDSTDTGNESLERCVSGVAWSGGGCVDV